MGRAVHVHDEILRVGGLERRLDGNVTDINTQSLQRECSYKWEGWGKAANAADTAVVTESRASVLTLQT